MLAFLLMFFQFTLCSSQDTITINQTFQDGDLLISKQKNFALGFFSPGSSSYRYLGIWFHKVQHQTVVWVANRNSPINGFSGYLTINQQGNLVLYGENQPVWSTNVSVQVNDALAVRLLDSGNLVLVKGRGERILWQSFDHPTNILLAGMKLGLHRKAGVNWFLTSWRSEDDPGIGDYTLELNQNGSPQIFMHHGTRVRWRYGPWPWKTYPQQYNYSFYDDGTVIYHSYKIPDDSMINIFLLDDSGFFKWLMWQESDKQWQEYWSTPKDRCDLYRQCGANSMCDPNILTIFECSCLPGYEPKYPRNWHTRDGSGGCIRKRLESSSVCGDGEGFTKVENVKIPDTSQDIRVSTSLSHMDCELECKRNCSCTAYASNYVTGNTSSCLTWHGELIDTRNYIGGIGYDLYVRVDALELAERAITSSSFLGMNERLILSVISAWFLIVIFALFWICTRKKNRILKSKRNKRLSKSTSGTNFQGDTLAAASELEGGRRNNRDLLIFNLSAILAATDNFSAANKIGEGGFGTVYKGQLLNGQEIAVKRMSEKSRQGIEEFKTEAILIGKLQHRNLVKLLGCCVPKKEQILIYEYLPNRSLDSFIFDQARRSLLDWETCFNIISGIARGILYLHQDSRLRIIHRDLKSSNILLDADMNPKISDFGMARILKNDQTQGKTRRVVGTYGYMSPEYAVFGKFSVKSDVFSFGVILLEIISGWKSNGFSQKDPSLSLIGQVWELWIEGRALEIFDSLLKGTCKTEEALRCIQVGLLCVQEDAMDRPTMLEVILMLNSETPLPSPKQPAFVFRASPSNTNSQGGGEGSCSINEVTITAILSR